jgi:hypothetical protein
MIASKQKIAIAITSPMIARERKKFGDPGSVKMAGTACSQAKKRSIIPGIASANLHRQANQYSAAGLGS